MRRLLVTCAVLAVVSLAACDKPVVVNVPAPVIGVPGPMGPQGAPGTDGATGTTGKTGDSTAIIVLPAASAPAN